MNVRKRDRVVALAKERSLAANLIGESKAVATAPAPRAEAVAEVDRQLDRIASAADVGAGRFATSGGPGPLSKLFLPPKLQVLPGGGGLESSGRDYATVLQSVMVALNRDRIVEMIAGELDQFYAANAEGLPADERARRLVELDAELLACEKREEALVRELEAEGQAVSRRADIVNLGVLVDAVGDAA